MDLVEVMLERIGGEYRCDAGIEAGAAERGQTGRLEFLVICPLPRIIEICREAKLPAALFVDRTPSRIVSILRLIVRRVDIMHAAFETGLHDREILIGECEIQHGIRLVCLDEREDSVLVVCIERRRRDDGFGLALCFDLCFQRIALGYSAAGNADLAEYCVILTAFLNGDGCNTAAADD